MATAVNRSSQVGQTERMHTMDFIERLFGVSPDAGTGATEATLLIGLAMVVFYFVKRRQSGFTGDDGSIA
jgi:hypothetical protein